ncbi:MAG: hypothetical protein LC808_28190, partial [Actinobacteria bacterium]|nr:hypothetical protein [Actinomycetota bacterium]
MAEVREGAGRPPRSCCMLSVRQLVGCTNSIPLQSGRLQGAAAGASDNKAGQRAAQRARDIPSCP